MQLFVGVGGACGTWYFGMKKGLRNPEGLCIHDGGDEGDRTPDLLTASQALSQLSYAPVTRRYYRGRFLVMQGLFLVVALPYGFSWDGAKIITLRAIIFIHRPDKTLMQQVRYRGSLMDGYYCCSSYYVADAGVG